MDRRLAFPRNLKGLLLLVLLLAAASLACFSAEIAVQVVHTQGEHGEVNMTMGMHLTEEYVRAAQEANQQRAADYTAAGLDQPEPLFPETWAEFEEEGFDTSDMLGDEDAEIIEQGPYGWTIAASITYTESEGIGEDSDGMSITVDRSDPELIRYTFELEIEDMGDEFDPSDLDELRSEGLGPKPEIDTSGGDVEIETDEENLGTEIVTGVLEQMLGAIPNAAGLELDAWYAERVILEAGFPEISYSVELPGKIVSHQLSGQTAGRVELPGNRVVLVMDEAFIRESANTSGVWKVVSELHKCDEVCGEKDPHMIWDGSSPPDSCACDCEEGWEKDSTGNACVQSTGRGATRPQYPARDAKSDDLVKLLESRGYSEENCQAGGPYPPGSVMLWSLGGGVAHSSVMTEGNRQIEMGDKPGGKRYVAALLPPGTNPDASRGRAYTLVKALCPPPGHTFNSSAAQGMDGTDRNYGEKDKWNCHGFSANMVARFATTGIRIEPGSDVAWDGERLLVKSGKVYVKDNHDIQIQLEGGTLHPQSEYIVTVKGSKAELTVLSGSVTFTGDEGSTTVRSGERLEIDKRGRFDDAETFESADVEPWWEEMDADLFEPGFSLFGFQLPSWLPIAVGSVCGLGLLVVVLGGVLVLRRRRKPKTAAPARVTPAQPARPVKPAPAKPTARAPMPTARVVPAAQAPTDPFVAAEQRFQALRARFEAGQLSPAVYQAEVQELTVQDSQGNYWAIGGPDGRWHWYDGQAWVPRDRPR